MSLLILNIHSYCISFSEIKHHGYKLFVDVLIDFPKPVIALVNGHAVGVSVTMLGVMDAVIAVDTVNLFKSTMGTNIED